MNPRMRPRLIGRSCLVAWLAVFSRLAAQELQPQELAFCLTKDRTTDIYAVDLAGRNQKQLTFGGSDHAPCWSPDGRCIAFHSHRSGGWKIHVLELSLVGEGRVRRLTESQPGGFRYEYFPAWSPDGRSIAFERWDPQQKNFEIHVVSTDGKNEANLTKHSAHDRQPVWSPDGSQILFTSQRDGNAEIYRMRADGSEVTNLTHNHASDYAAAWSPSGQRILFHSNRDGKFRTYVMDQDGKQAKAVDGMTAVDHAQGWTERDSSTDSIPFRALRSSAQVFASDDSVLVTSHRSGSEGVYLVSLKRHNVRKVVDTELREFLPALRPLSRDAAGH